MVAERSTWPVRRYELGDEPGDDLSATTSAGERLAMVWPLTVEAWVVAGRPLPSYPRNETPVSVRKTALAREGKGSGRA